MKKLKGLKLLRYLKYLMLLIIPIVFMLNNFKSRASEKPPAFINKIAKEARQEMEKLKIMNTLSVVHKANTTKKLVAITFDDGPDARFTPKVLDILKKHNAKATFFVVGNQALQNSDIIERAIYEKNEIENHTFTHPHMDDLDDNQMMKEFNMNQKALKERFNLNCVFFRPPRGVCTKSFIKKLEEKKVRTIFWTICFEHKAQPDPIKRAVEVADSLKPGYIILMHDGRLNRSRTVDGLDQLLQDIKKRGFKCVTLKELIKENDLNNNKLKQKSNVNSKIKINQKSTP